MVDDRLQTMTYWHSFLLAFIGASFAASLLFAATRKNDKQSKRVHLNYRRQLASSNLAQFADPKSVTARSDSSNTNNIDLWTRSANCIPGAMAMACTPSGLIWEGYPTIQSNMDPCAILAGKQILFIGDSFVRHAFVAFVLWLSGDYTAGALQSPHDIDCEGPGQFAEKKCRAQLKDTVQVCRGQVSYTGRDSAWPTISADDVSNNDYIVWGAGNHGINGVVHFEGAFKRRHGVNNAKVLQKYIIAPTCRAIPRNATMGAKVVWLNTHVRITHRYKDETRPVLQKYHDEMPVVLANECNITKFASVWDLTRALVDYHPDDAAQMTWDGAHWGGVVNLYKAYAIFNAMIEQ